MERKFNWIHDEVKIDFSLPPIIQDIVDELELLDEAGDDLYFDRSEFLEHYTKEFIYSKEMTHKQRNTLLERYG